MLMTQLDPFNLLWFKEGSISSEYLLSTDLRFPYLNPKDQQGNFEESCINCTLVLPVLLSNSFSIRVFLFPELDCGLNKRPAKRCWKLLVTHSFSTNSWKTEAGGSL